MNPRFVSLDRVLAIHARQLAEFGGLAGVRDAGLLESALAAAEASFGGRYLHADLAEMAAAYLFHIARNHPFFDGNKRVAAAVAVVFLEQNGLQFKADAEAFADMVLEVARGHVDKPPIAEFLRSNVRPA